MQMNGSFNANQFEPNQGMSGHPPALKIPFTITSTAIKENASKDGGYFEVVLTSQLGDMVARYNIWNKTPKAVEIAHGQLSALCRATNIYQIDWSNEGAALKGGKGLMDVGYQKGEEPSPDNPNAKGYTELKKVYDPAGNEPGKTVVSQAQPQTQPQGGPTPVNAAAQQGGWGHATSNAAQPSQQPNPAQQAPNQAAGGAWQPGGNGQAAAGSNPPWGSRT
jgi:hypothetical protein